MRLVLINNLYIYTLMRTQKIFSPYMSLEDVWFSNRFF